MTGVSLLPCPFCANGNKALQIFKDGNGLDYVRCLGCGATGPRRWNPQDPASDPAMNGWNVRAWVPPSHLGPVEDDCELAEGPDESGV